MKVPAAQVDRYIDRPGDGVASILLYGPDQGLIGERARRSTKRIVDDLDDPFNVAEFIAEDLKGASGRLVDEVQAMSLMGGRRVVRLRQAGDATTVILKGLFELPAQEAFLVVEAGDLGPASSLRRLFEKSDKAAALPCYRDEAATLGDVIRSTLRDAGLAIEPDALQHLQAHLGGDRELTRSELDKLVLYMGADRDARVRLDDVDAVIGDSSALMTDDLVWAILTGNAAKAGAAMSRLLAEGQQPVRIVRAVSSTLMRMLPMRVEVESGKAAAQVIAGARPPVHFRRKEVMRRVLDRRSSSDLTRALAIVFETERRCKTTGLPDALMLQSMNGRLSSLFADRRR